MCSVLLEVSYTPWYTSLPLRQALAEKCDKVCGGGGGGKVGGVLGCLLRLRRRTYSWLLRNWGHPTASRLSFEAVHTVAKVRESYSTYVQYREENFMIHTRSWKALLRKFAKEELRGFW